ncbi:hypothetical protein ARMGADRAFT_1129697 [Armillaria gallica]|uniref:Hydrophobin n=1 Tax=Armillaria gallica TaxID=47427 RepID=A0A2H3D1D6_ARMGA|nr:hypothetical protein ARMGADRAFT_1129697 [Armillaria gallica]
MFPRLSSVTLLALPLLTSATAFVSHSNGASSATGTAQCCDSVQSPTSSAIQTLLGLLRIPIGDVTAMVLPVSMGENEKSNLFRPIKKRKAMGMNSVVALDCTPINIGLYRTLEAS